MEVIGPIISNLHGSRKAIAIIFSGYCNDGTEGCKRIKVVGGLTFAQDAAAEIPSMPLNAQATGCIDYVLAPGEIAGAVQKLVTERSLNITELMALGKR